MGRLGGGSGLLSAAAERRTRCPQGDVDAAIQKLKDLKLAAEKLQKVGPTAGGPACLAPWRPDLTRAHGLSWQSLHPVISQYCARRRGEMP